MSDFLEPLEQRRLLTIPVSGSGSNLTLDLDDSPDVSYITSGNDFLEIILSSGNIQVRNSSGTVIDSRSSTNIIGINVNTGGGNDTVRIGGPNGGSILSIPVTIHGGAGNDSIIGGLGNDQLFGDGDNDRLDGRAGQDVLDGGTGFDTADYSVRANQVKVSLDGSNNDGTNSGNNSSPAQYNDSGHDNVLNMEAVLGGTGPDSLTGNSSANWFDGGGGNDSIFGGDGVDTITGGVNTDLAYGEGGDDYFFMQDSTGDQFLGGTGTTTAQYDTSLDLPAPALPAAITSSLTSLVPHASLTSAEPEFTDNLQVDDTFADGGALQGLIGAGANIYGVVVQPQIEGPDKIIVVGTAQVGDGLDYDMVMMRFNSDGTLDESFADGDGVVYTDLTGAANEYDFGNGETGLNDSAASVILDSQGRIVVVGTTANPNSGESRIAVVRYDADGLKDNSFGFGGVVVLNPYNVEDPASHLDTGSRIALQQVSGGEGPVEDYVVSGTFETQFFDAFSESAGDQIDFGMTRLDGFGNTDFGFGGGGDDLAGYTTLDYFGADDFNTGLAIDGEFDNIWLTGYEQTSSSGNLLVGGFDSDGLPIPGAVGTKSFGTFDVGSDAMINSSGQLVVVGTTDEFYGTVTAFDINPSSGTFAQAVNWNFASGAGNVSLNAVTRDNEGHGIAVGSVDGNDFFVYRFDGNTLAQFGDTITKDFGETLDKDSADIAYGVAVQSDGNIVVAGTASDPFAALVRFQPQPQEPPFVDVTLTPEDVQNLHLTYTDENGDPQDIPDYLIQRIKAILPDGTFEIHGTSGDDLIEVSQDDPDIITASVNGSLLSVPASEVTKIVIFADEGDDTVHVADNVTEPYTILTDRTYLSDLTPTSPTNGWGPYEKDKSNGETGAHDGHTITLEGVTYAKGLGVHALSDQVYALNGNYTRFVSDIGIDDEVGSNGNVVFQVFADGVKLFDSGAMTGSSATKRVDLDVTGRTQLRLVVLTNGSDAYDHADWAGARVLTNSAPPPPPPPGDSVYLSDQTPTLQSSGWGPVEKDTSNGEIAGGDGHTLTLNTQTYAKGLGVHSNSELDYNLSGNYTRFTADVGIDDEVGSNGNVIFQVFVDGVKRFDSGAMTGASATQHVDVDLTGKNQLKLLVLSNGSNAYDHADWADAKLFTNSEPPPPPSDAFISDLTPTLATNGWGPIENDTSNGENVAGDGHTLTLNTQTYARGLGVHSNSDVRYAINGAYARFTADVGIDDEVGNNGNVIFQVWADGVKLFDSGAMTGASVTQHVDVNLTGRNELKLLVLNNGSTAYDHADWADAKVHV